MQPKLSIFVLIFIVSQCLLNIYLFTKNSASKKHVEILQNEAKEIHKQLHEKEQLLKSKIELQHELKIAHDTLNEAQRKLLLMEQELEQTKKEKPKQIVTVRETKKKIDFWNYFDTVDPRKSVKVEGKYEWTNPIPCLSDDIVEHERQTKQILESCPFSKKLFLKNNDDAYNFGITELFEIFKEFLYCQVPFAVTRYGDGEYYIIHGWKISKDTQAFHRDKWYWDGIIGNVTSHLKESLTGRGNYFLGLPCPPWTAMTVNYLKMAKQPAKYLSYSTIWMGSNYAPFVELMHEIINNKLVQRVILMISKHAAPYVHRFQWAHDVIFMHDDFPNWWEKNHEIGTAYFENLAKSHKNTLFLISAGPVSEIIIYKMWNACKCNQYLDVGSRLDFFTKENEYPAVPERYPPEIYEKDCPRYRYEGGDHISYKKPYNEEVLFKGWNEETRKPRGW